MAQTSRLRTRREEVQRNERIRRLSLLTTGTSRLHASRRQARMSEESGVSGVSICCSLGSSRAA